MELSSGVRRDMELAAAVRAAAEILNHAVEAAADAGLLVTVEVSSLDMGEPVRVPRVVVAVDKG
jgi:20S proteasome alpha/beta subunit